MSDSEKLAAYEATLRRQEIDWQAKNDRIQLSDEAAVNIGIGAIKTIILINAGAVVAFLAFIGQLWNHDPIFVGRVLHASIPFIIGLASASFSFSIAYFYQSTVTFLFQCEASHASDPKTNMPSPSSIRKPLACLSIVMILSAFIGLGAFIYGSYNVINVFESSIENSQQASSTITPINHEENVHPLTHKSRRVSTTN